MRQTSSHGDVRNSQSSCWLDKELRECVTVEFVCAHTHTLDPPQMSENTSTAVQTHVHGRRHHMKQQARAAASRRRHDPVTAGKTEFVKSELPLMKKNTDPCPAHKGDQSGNRPGRRANKDGSRAAWLPWTARVLQREQSRPGRTHAHPCSGRVLGCVWLACACVCVLTSQLSACFCPLAMCASASPGGSGSRSSCKTQNDKMQWQIKVWLVPSFLSSTKPGLICEQTRRQRGRREERLQPVERGSKRVRRLPWNNKWRMRKREKREGAKAGD